MTRKKILIIVLVVLGIILLFTLRTKDKKPKTDTVLDTGASVNMVLNNDFVNDLLGVQTINLDTGLLTSPVFKSLVSSGAMIDENPPKGRLNPFAPTNSSLAGIDFDQPFVETSPRNLNLGKSENLLSPVKINVSKITSLSASISITGLPADTDISVSVETNSGDSVQIIDYFSRKIITEEYTAIVTNLKSKTKYTIYINQPSMFNDIKAEFQTK